MRSTFKIVTAILLIASMYVLSGCSKDENNSNAGPCPAATYPVEGLWEGTYTVTASTQPPLYYSMAIFPNGTIITKGLLTSMGDSSYSHGTWTLNGSNFVADIITFEGTISQQINATFSNNGTFSNATWAVTASPWTFNDGQFQAMNRIN